MHMQYTLRGYVYHHRFRWHDDAADGVAGVVVAAAAVIVVIVVAVAEEETTAGPFGSPGRAPRSVCRGVVGQPQRE